MAGQVSRAPQRRVARAPGAAAVGGDERALLSVETAQCCGSLGSTTTSIGGAGGVGVFQVLPPSRARPGCRASRRLTPTICSPDDLELVVVGLAELRQTAPRCRRGRRSGSARGSRAASPPLRVAGGEQVAGARRSARRGCRTRSPAPWSVVSLPVIALALLRARRDAVERRAGADHHRAVAGVDR